MTINEIVPIIPISSTAVDAVVRPFDSLIVNVPEWDGTVGRINRDMEVIQGDNIYIFDADDRIFAGCYPCSVAKDLGTWKVGDVVVEEFRLSRIVDVRDNVAPPIFKEPEEYDNFETDIFDYNNFTERYFRLDKKNLLDSGYPIMWDGNVWYYIFEERRGYGACKKPAWQWSARDLAVPMNSGTYAFLRSCLIDTTTYKYDIAKDIKADIVTMSVTGGVPKEVIQFRSVVERGDYFYFRTQVETPPEVIADTTWSTDDDMSIYGFYYYKVVDIEDILDIPGFVYKRKAAGAIVYDNKSYTKYNGVGADWVFHNTRPFDSVTLTSLIADSVTIQISNIAGDTIYEELTVNDVVNYSTHGISKTIYLGNTYNDEVRVTATINGYNIQVGEILLGSNIMTAMTDKAFSSSGKDYSYREEDQWGNYLEVEREKVTKKSGKMISLITDLDEQDRKLTEILGRRVIIDGSDNHDNNATDSKIYFQTLNAVGRFKKLERNTVKDGNRMGQTFTISFDFEESI